MGIQQHWSLTPGNNQTSDPSINWREGQAPSTVNDSTRMVMTKLKAYALDNAGVLTTTGTATAYVIAATNEGFTALVDGMTIVFRPHVTNSAGATLVVDGLAAVALQGASGVPIIQGALPAGIPARATYFAGINAWLAHTLGVGYLDAPVGTRMVFHQTAAPLGWVKEVGAAFNDAALRLTTGVVGSGGVQPFTTAFANRTIAQANLPVVSFVGTADAQGSHSHGGITGGGGAHSHTAADGTAFWANTGAGGSPTGGTGMHTQATTSAVGDHQHALLADGLHTHNVTVSSGGAGTALDFRVTFHDLIIAAKA